MLVAGITMAKKRIGRPPKDRQDVSIKFDMVLRNRAQMVARARGLSLAEYLEEIAGPAIDRDCAKLLRELEGGGK